MEDKCRCSFLCFHSLTSRFGPNRHILTTHVIHFTVNCSYTFKKTYISNQRWRFYTNIVDFLNEIHKKPIGGCRSHMDVCVNQSLTPDGTGSGGGGGGGC